MPSKLPAILVRLEEAEVAEFEAIRQAASAAIGIKVSQADLVRLGIRELRKLYPPPYEAAEEKPAGKKKGGKK